ncbi:MAG: glycosyltransferase, partial [Staphylococcus hyicus]|uniref:glycosyltransferase n=1 Tax=Staphylococcus hyicus TaxID=1284 RepID=UPI002A7EAF7D
ALKENDYFLVVGRFVPENNYATMIAEFMKSKVKKDLVLITNVEHNKFYEELKKETGFDKDPRIKFVGTVYDGDLLKYIRENAFGYLHGHSVGGTNPSLLEALSSTKLNLLYDVGFNREVGQDAVLYWTKDNGSLKKLLDSTESMDIDNIRKLGINAKERIENAYSWEYITEKYDDVFISEG